MINKKYNVTGMTCASCSAHVDKAVKEVDGVIEVSVNLLTNSMQVLYDEKKIDDEKICNAVSSAGYGASLMEDDIHSEDKFKDKETRKMLIRLLLSILFLLPLMYVTMGYMMWNWPVPSFMDYEKNPLPVAIYEIVLTIIIMVINRKFFISGFKSMIHLSANMDALVALGSGTSFIYSIVISIIMTISYAHGNQDAYHYLHSLYFESSAMILTLITVGKTLESYSKGKTTSALKGLMDLQPKKALIIYDNKEMEVDIAEVKEKDIFVVKPGMSIPVDGKVLEGNSSVDESSLSGESLPVEKQKDDMVKAGTINHTGYLKCEAIRVGKDTTLSRIIALVEDTNATKAPIARTADKVSGIFVPGVMGISLVVFIIWMIISKDIAKALNYAICVLVISCPCALGLATPVAIMVGSGIGAKKGILFKTATSLEMAGKCDIVVLDKTGTITKGEPEVSDIQVISEMEEKEFVSLCASLENKSEHPLAKAVVEYAIKNDITLNETESFTALVGNGVEGKVKGHHIIGGSLKFIQKKINCNEDIINKCENLSKEGKTPLLFIIDDQFGGIISVQDALKEDSLNAVEELKKMNKEVIMLTGDNFITAQAIASSVGLKERVIANVLPGDKESIVRKLQSYGKVMMVGDGINDSPALTRADIGLAIGKGNDIAKDASDVVLMKSSLSDVVRTIKLSSRIILNIKENLFWAFIYNVICIPLAAGAFAGLGISLKPMYGALAMSLSSFFVVSNALRLNICNIDKTKSINKVKVTIDETLFLEKEDKEMMRKELKVEGMMCMHCVAHVKKALEGVEGVKTAEVSLENNNAIVEGENLNNENLIKAVTDAGYEVKEIK